MIGEVTKATDLVFLHGTTHVAKVPLATAEHAWKRPLDLDAVMTKEVTK